MSDNSTPYWEKQQGGLCRMHALNAFFGEHKITSEMFEKYCDEYDKDIANRYNSNISSRDFDLVNSDQMNVVTWILKKYGIWTQYYALNELYGKKLILPDHAVNEFAFVYNDGHIWGIKKKNNLIWEIDSLKSGPIVSNFDNFQNNKNVGFIFPVEIVNEFYAQINKLNRVLPNNLQDIKNCLVRLNKEKKILGGIEIPLNKIVNILEWHEKLYPKYMNKFQPIYNLIADYNIFLSKFTNGNYLNLDLILKYLPEILHKLINISRP